MYRLHLGRHFTACQCLSLHVEIDFGIDVRRIQRDMTKPGPNRINIDPSPQKMDRRGVANLPIVTEELPTGKGAQVPQLVGVHHRIKR